MAQKDAYLSSETVLAVMSKDKATKAAFQAASVNEDRLSDAIEKLRGGESVQTENDEENRGALDKYCLDLTARASEGKLDPAIVESYARHGFYVFTNVLGAEERADAGVSAPRGRCLAQSS